MTKKKKSYNPFKLWGSYVGSIIGLSSGLALFWNDIALGINKGAFFTRKMYGGCEDIIVNGTSQTLCFDAIARPVINFIGISIGLTIIGFIIGYGIHSLIRKIRK